MEYIIETGTLFMPVRPKKGGPVTLKRYAPGSVIDMSPRVAARALKNIARPKAVIDAERAANAASEAANREAMEAAAAESEAEISEDDVATGDHGKKSAERAGKAA